jgi:hypothetical protein
MGAEQRRRSPFPRRCCKPHICHSLAQGTLESCTRRLSTHLATQVRSKLAASSRLLKRCHACCRQSPKSPIPDLSFMPSNDVSCPYEHLQIGDFWVWLPRSIMDVASSFSATSAASAACTGVVKLRPRAKALSLLSGAAAGPS